KENSKEESCEETLRALSLRGFLLWSRITVIAAYQAPQFVYVRCGKSRRQALPFDQRLQLCEDDGETAHGFRRSGFARPCNLALTQASSGIDRLVPHTRQTQIFTLAWMCATCKGFEQTGQLGTTSHGSSSEFSGGICAQILPHREDFLNTETALR